MKLSVYNVVGIVLNILALVVYFGIYRRVNNESVFKDIAFFYLVFVQIVNLVYVLIRPR